MAEFRNFDFGETYKSFIFLFVIAVTDILFVVIILYHEVSKLFEIRIELKPFWL